MAHKPPERNRKRAPSIKAETRPTAAVPHKPPAVEFFAQVGSSAGGQIQGEVRWGVLGMPAATLCADTMECKQFSGGLEFSFLELESPTSARRRVCMRLSWEVVRGMAHSALQSNNFADNLERHATTLEAPEAAEVNASVDVSKLQEDFTTWAAVTRPAYTLGFSALDVLELDLHDVAVAFQQIQSGSQQRLGVRHGRHIRVFMPVGVLARYARLIKSHATAENPGGAMT